MVPIIAILTFLVFFTIDYFVQRATRQWEQAQAAQSPPPDGRARTASPPEAVEPIPAGSVPAGVLLDRGHLWVRIERSGAFRVGTDSLASTLLGGAERVELQAPGARIARGRPMAVLSRGSRRIPGLARRSRAGPHRRRPGA